jgi:uncharacterized protein YndB with AHSA1/START domain
MRANLASMQKIEVQRRFAVSPQELWDVYTDHERWSEWAGFSQSWLEVEGGTHRNGTGAVRGFRSGGISVYEEVREFDPPRRMTYSVVRGGPPFENHLGEVLLEPDGRGSRLTWRCRFDSRVPGLGWPLRLLVGRVFRRALDGLERHLEPESRRRGD